MVTITIVTVALVTVTMVTFTIVTVTIVTVEFSVFLSVKNIQVSVNLEQIS